MARSWAVGSPFSRGKKGGVALSKLPGGRSGVCLSSERRVSRNPAKSFATPCSHARSIRSVGDNAAERCQDLRDERRLVSPRRLVRPAVGGEPVQFQAPESASLSLSWHGDGAELRRPIRSAAGRWSVASSSPAGVSCAGEVTSRMEAGGRVPLLGHCAGQLRIGQPGTVGALSVEAPEMARWRAVLCRRRRACTPP